jgi:hypothetical protein
MHVTHAVIPHSWQGGHINSESVLCAWQIQYNKYNSHENLRKAISATKIMQRHSREAQFTVYESCTVTYGC